MLAPAGGRVLFVAGQTARDGSDAELPDGFVEQFEATLANILAVVREAGGSPEDIGRFTIYVADIEAYRSSLKAVGHGLPKSNGPSLSGDGARCRGGAGGSDGPGRDRSDCGTTAS